MLLSKHLPPRVFLHGFLSEFLIFLIYLNVSGSRVMLLLQGFLFTPHQRSTGNLRIILCTLLAIGMGQATVMTCEASDEASKTPVALSQFDSLDPVIIDPFFDSEPTHATSATPSAASILPEPLTSMPPAALKKTTPKSSVAPKMPSSAAPTSPTLSPIKPAQPQSVSSGQGKEGKSLDIPLKKTNKTLSPPKDSPSNAAPAKPVQAAHVKIEKHHPPATAKSLESLYERMAMLDAQIAHQLRDDEEAHLKAITFIWQAAVERSDTIRYAIDQLSNRDPMQSGKTDSGEFSKKLLRTLGQLGGTAGTILTGSPVGMVGSQMVNELVGSTAQDARNARLKITDTDMLFLARAVSSLQEDVIEAYETWQGAIVRLALAQDARRAIGRYASSAEASLPNGFDVIVDSLLQTQAQQVNQAQSDVQQARNTLLLIAGSEALSMLDALSKEQAPSSTTKNVERSIMALP
ncbi:MAG: hypothetical protein VKK59_06110 [Vampirovibrionales bacterium]|nr:hypothetical protein [Vampirovibrionales bacterium]